MIRLGIKPWAGGMDLAQEIPFVAYCLFFFFLSEIYEYYYCLLILCFMPRHQVNGKSLIVALGMHYSFRIFNL